jgi:hypothetical protein
MHAGLMQSRFLCRDEVDQLREVAGTNEAHLGDSYSFSRILLYNPCRIVGRLANQEIEQADIKVARALGRRVAEVTKKFVLVTTS